jgi:hypothetical protein
MRLRTPVGFWGDGMLLNGFGDGIHKKMDGD